MGGPVTRQDRRRRVAELTGRGLAQTDIARRLGCSVRTVRRDLAEPVIAARAREVRSQVDPSASDVLRDLLSSEREDIRLAAARALLTLKVPDLPDGATESSAVQVHVIPGRVDRGGD